MIRTAISNAATTLNTPDVLILAVIIRESSGNARIATPLDSDGTPTGGLMQCAGEPGFPSFDSNNNPIQVFFTQDDINRMVFAGANHLAGNYNEHNQDFWSAVREYNSGSVPDPTDLNNIPANDGVPEYMEDIENILHGYVMGSQAGH